MQDIKTGCPKYGHVYCYTTTYLPPALITYSPQNFCCSVCIRKEHVDHQQQIQQLWLSHLMKYWHQAL